MKKIDRKCCVKNVLRFLNSDIAGERIDKRLNYRQGILITKRYYLLDPRPRPEGSYKIGSVLPSVRPSFCLSVSFLRIGSLVFSETQHGVRVPCIVTCDRAGFYGKNPHRTKMTKNGQKGPQNWVFGLFKKIMSLVLSGICVK